MGRVENPGYAIVFRVHRTRWQLIFPQSSNRLAFLQHVPRFSSQIPRRHFHCVSIYLDIDSHIMGKRFERSRRICFHHRWKLKIPNESTKLVQLRYQLNSNQLTAFPNPTKRIKTLVKSNRGRDEIDARMNRELLEKELQV